MTKIKNFWTENWKWVVGTVGIGIFITGFNYGETYCITESV